MRSLFELALGGGGLGHWGSESRVGLSVVVFVITGGFGSGEVVILELGTWEERIERRMDEDGAGCGI